MIRPFIEISTAHLPEQEVDLVSCIITDLKAWELAFDGPTGVVLWIGYREDHLCPATLKSVLNHIASLHEGVAYVMLQADAEHIDLPVFDW